MYVNGKMRPVETIPGIVGRGIKENDGGVSSTMTYLIYSKNCCKCHNVPPSQP
jgi:L-lactate utilization protein LutB